MMTDTAQEIRGTLQAYCGRATDDEIERAVQVLDHAFHDTKSQTDAGLIALVPFKARGLHDDRHSNKRKRRRAARLYRAL